MNRREAVQTAIAGAGAILLPASQLEAEEKNVEMNVEMSVGDLKIGQEAFFYAWGDKGEFLHDYDIYRITRVEIPEEELHTGRNIFTAEGDPDPRLVTVKTTNMSGFEASEISRLVPAKMICFLDYDKLLESLINDMKKVRSPLKKGKS